MDRLQLAILVAWAGPSGLQGRKRLQKVVYFLQTAGCPIVADYSLHHYGPYSRDVADVCDDMVAANLLAEQPGNHYVYTLPEPTAKLIEKTQSTAPDRVAAMERFRETGTELLRADLGQLELGSTILYFKQSGLDWNAALLKACEFKKKLPAATASLEALGFAKKFVASGEATGF